MFSIPANCQITGYVYDGNNALPLNGAVVRSLKNGYTISDASGKFEFGKAALPERLIISHIGYKTSGIEVTDTVQQLRIEMVPVKMEINEVIISASEFKQKIRSVPASVSVITKKELNQSDNGMITDPLNRIPGVFMQSGSLNTNRIIIRGIGSRSPYSTNKVKVYFEDILITTGEGVTTAEDIDIETLGRIEIIRGPASGIYGAGMGGVIVLSANRPAINRQYLNLSGVMGSFGMFTTTGQFSYNSGKTELTGGVNYLYSDGYRKNNQYSRYSAHFLTMFDLKKTKMKLFLYHVGLNAYIPSSLDEQTFNLDPKAAATNWLSVKGNESYNKSFLGTVLVRKINSSLLSHTSVFASVFAQDELRPFNVLEDNSFSGGFRTRFEYRRATISIATGMEFYNELYKWKLFETVNGTKGIMFDYNAETHSFVNFFGHIKKEFGTSADLIAGLNVNRLIYRFNNLYSDSSESSMVHKFQPILSPRIGFNYQLKIPVSVYCLISHGFSAPSLEETLNPEGVINSSIMPESGINFETGSKGSLIGNRLMFEITAYKMFVKNLLVTKRISEDVFTGVNAGRSEHQGIELTAKYRFFESMSAVSPSISVFFSATISSNRFTDFVDDGISYKSKYLPGIPKSVFNAGIQYLNDEGLNFSILYRYAGSMFLNDANTGKTNGYCLLNARIAYVLKYNKSINTEFFAGFNNLLNKHYASMILVNAKVFGNQSPRYYYPGLPFNFVTGFRFLFRK